MGTVARAISAQGTHSSSATHVWTPIGAGTFILALVGSAIVVPQLRVLHFFQALIYVAVIIFARRNSMWGFGGGITVAVAWNGLNLFITHNIQGGAIAFWTLLRTGEVHRVDTMMVTLGGIGHCILIVACLVALFDGKTVRNWWKFAGGGIATMAYFAMIVFLFLPRK